MELYKVLLVDDEADVRESIVQKIEWASLGFEVAGQAGNGEEALELAERLQPDVLMTDIKMPFMDGLDLCRRVRRLLPGIHIAIFSGFDEFEYAREAISQQVEEYILKPIDAQELTEVFRRLRAAMDAEITERRDIQRLRRYYEQSLPLLQQQMLIELLENRMSPRNLARQVAGYDLDIEAQGYCVAVLQYRCGGERPPEELRLLEISLCRLLQDTLQTRARFHLVQRLDRVVLLFLLDGKATAWVMELLNPLFALCHKLLNMRVSIGVGHCYAEPEQIALSHEQACDALEYRMLAEYGQCIYIGDMEPGLSPSASPDAKYAQELLRHIRTGTEQEMGEAVRLLIDHLRQLQTSVQQIRIYLLELLADLFKYARTSSLDSSDDALDALLQQGMRLSFSYLDELGEWLLQYCEKLRAAAQYERSDSLRQLIKLAASLLREQYADSDLSLESVCAQLNVSTAYLSTVFKKETGQGFISYLTDLRMEKALELLTTSSDKTYQVAQAVGYLDPNYFSYVFKRKFGVSPTKYRSDRMSANEPEAPPV